MGSFKIIALFTFGVVSLAKGSVAESYCYTCEELGEYNFILTRVDCNRLGDDNVFKLFDWNEVVDIDGVLYRKTKTKISTKSLLREVFKYRSLCVADRQIELQQPTTDRYTTTSLAPSTTEILPRTDADCPEWTEHAGSLYCFISKIIKWQEAEDICQSYTSHTHLVYIKSEQENMFVSDLFYQNKPSQGGLNDAWIGLTDSETEGVWKWLDGTELDYDNWSPNYGEPNGKANTDEDCAFMTLYYDHNNGQWVDHFCSVHQAHFVCEHELV